MQQYLIANNYILTALELLVEAQEAGREQDVEYLQTYFSDKSKFPPEEVAKFNPADGTFRQTLIPCPDEQGSLLQPKISCQNSCISNQMLCSVSAAVNIQTLAREREEKLSLLEYELRVTREDVLELQVALGLTLCHPSICCTVVYRESEFWN